MGVVQRNLNIQLNVSPRPGSSLNSGKLSTQEKKSWGKNRLEAFSDAVLIIIIIAIIVLEMKVPHGVEISALTPLIPVFLSYVLCFVYLAIYWNNHQHIEVAVDS